jgi:uncharacterized protein YqgC (DUF456 family)
MGTVAVATLGLMLCAIGLVGCVVPILPGPPISWLALLLLWITHGETGVSDTLLIVMGLLAAGVTALDYVVPAWGAKRAGASRGGTWGAFGGMLAGLIWFPPFGMILGSFLGAMAGEVLAGRTDARAVKAAWGVFVGTMLGTVLKLAAAGVITYYFVIGVL